MHASSLHARFARAIVAVSLAIGASAAHAFCGFYVGKADVKLFNEASQVILARDGERTVISMLNDYRGDLKEFALVVPVPEVLRRGQIHIGDRRVFDRIADYSAPRLAEYFDDDPCAKRELEEKARMAAPASASMTMQDKGALNKALGVTVEASYTVGEYDIVILAAKESDGLETWLVQNGYRIPRGASKALRPYIKQEMKFFVAKVNLKEQAKTGATMLRPLQFAFESKKFMLPLRLGMINANGPQDLIAFVLSKNGRVESTNYRTVKLPANMDLPVGVRADFQGFYKAMFDAQAKREQHRVVFTEYFWDMSWCDPCAADPLSPEELRAAGVFWLDGGDGDTNLIGVEPSGKPRVKRPAPASAAQPVMLTRLHVRYTPETFPEDLMFQQTADRENFQARYVLRHAWKGDPNACPEAARYLESVRQREEREARALAELTATSLNELRSKYGIKAPGKRQWWERLWQESRETGGAQWLSYVGG